MLQGQGRNEGTQQCFPAPSHPHQPSPNWTRNVFLLPCRISLSSSEIPGEKASIPTDYCLTWVMADLGKCWERQQCFQAQYVAILLSIK